MKYVPVKVSRAVGLTMLKASKNSPTLLFGAGIIGVISTAVLASKATLRLDDEVLNPAQVDIEIVNGSVGATGYIKGTPSYTEKDRDHDKMVIYVRSALKIVKLYGPTIIVGGLSIAALTGSHKILTTRNNGLVAAYAVVEKSFEEYRKRVAAEVGDEKERDIYQDVTTIDIAAKDSSDGKKHKIRKAGQPSMYARFFDQMNRNWQVDPESNRIFISAQQDYLMHRLNTKGWVALNEAYRCLGLEETSEGQQVGWVSGYAGTSKGGDPYVDFGLGDWPHASDYVNGREVGILLDFNVTTILDKI